MRHSTNNWVERKAAPMRGADIEQGGMFSYVSLESRVPQTHPLRQIRALLDEALGSMHRDFERVYASGGRSSIAPRHRAYLASQRLSKRIEEIFGWSKDGRPLRKMRVVGMRNATFIATLTIGCNTLLRVAKLLPAPA